MILHDSFFFSINETINETVLYSTMISHSPVFHSRTTLIISLFGCLSNTICFLKLTLMHRPPSRNRLLNDTKHKFLVVLIGNTLSLSILSLISVIDQRFFHQNLIARYHLCSLSIFLWKFTLHLLPLLTIFILLYYHYQCYERFRCHHYNTTIGNQLLSPPLSIILPYILAFTWSIDVLWLWGEKNMKEFIQKIFFDDQTTDSIVLRELQQKSLQQLKQPKICYLQTNDDMKFTSRLLFFVQLDYGLLFTLHLIGNNFKKCETRQMTVLF